MASDPFSEFSKVFAGEFGRALTSAWQETLTKTFANSFTDHGLGSFGSTDPFALIQQFISAFPGQAANKPGLGADYFQFGQFIKPYLDMFTSGAEPDELSEQMSKAFRMGGEQLVGSMQSFGGLLKQLGHIDGTSDFLSAASKIFASQTESFASAPFSAFNGDFGLGEFTQAKTPAALGPSREWQLAFDDVLKAGDRLRAAQTRMQEHTSATLESASSRFWQDMGKGDEELTSMKAVYDYWVTCAEEAYYEIVMTDEYSADFGEMVNSQADFKVKFTAFIDRFLEMLNIPNRRELNGIIGQLARVESRLENLEKFDVGDSSEPPERDSEVQDLRAEIVELKARLQAANRQTETSEVVSITASKKSEKPKTAKRSGTKPSDAETSNKKEKASKKKTARKSGKVKAHADFDITNITGSKR